MLNIECNKCHHNNKLTYNASIGGKQIMFKCKNKLCGEFITIRLPKNSAIDSDTIVVERSAPVGVKAFIELVNFDDTVRFPLNTGKSVIGRISENKHPDIVLNVADTSLSRMHCVIEGLKNDNGDVDFIIMDYKSKNGVRLNGLELSKHDQVYLEPSDEIHLGRTILKFRRK